MTVVSQVIHQLRSNDPEERLSAIKTLQTMESRRLTRNQHSFQEVIYCVLLIILTEKNQIIKDAAVDALSVIAPDVFQEYREGQDRAHRHQIELGKVIDYCEGFRGRPEGARRVIDELLEQGADEGEFANPALSATFKQMARVEPQVIPNLLAGLKRSPHLIATLEETLCEVAPHHPDLRETLIPMLDEGDLEVRVAALKILASMGCAAEDAIGGLIPRLREWKVEEEMDALVKATGRLAACSDEWLEILVSNLHNTGDRRIRESFALALCYASEENAPAALRRIEELLDHKDEGIRKAVCEAVITAYDGLSDLRAVFPTMLKDPSRIIRRKAARALEDGSTIPILRSTADFLPLLQSDDQVLRRIGLRTIGRMGFEAFTATPHILKLLNDSLRSVRLAAVSALLKVNPTTAPEQIKAVLEEAEEFGDFDEQRKAERLRKVLRSLDS